MILDWKTGDDSDVELQIPLYALYCRTVLGLPFRDEEWFGRVVKLATGEDTTREITRIDDLGAAERVRDSVSVMHSLLSDADGNQPRPMEEFPIWSRSGGASAASARFSRSASRSWPRCRSRRDAPRQPPTLCNLPRIRVLV